MARPGPFEGCNKSLPNNVAFGNQSMPSVFEHVDAECLRSLYHGSESTLAIYVSLHARRMA